MHDQGFEWGLGLDGAGCVTGARASRMGWGWGLRDRGSGNVCYIFKLHALTLKCFELCKVRINYVKLRQITQKYIKPRIR